MDWFEQQQLRRAKVYPTEEEAIAAMNDAYARLCDLGWRQPAYLQYFPDPAEPLASTVIGSPQVHYAVGHIHPAATLWAMRKPPQKDQEFTRRSTAIFNNLIVEIEG